MYDVIIIGAGPAGLSAAVYGKRAGFHVLVLEKNPMSGGQVLNTCEVDNYLGFPGIDGFLLGTKFREHADRMKIPFENGEVTELADGEGCLCITAAVDGERKRYQAKAVIIASGATHALLNVPGEDRLTGRGVSYCATCDGAFFRGKNVAVVGGGDVAAEDAIFLSRICNKVVVIHRRDRLRAAKSLQERLFQCPNVEILWDSVVEEICGKEQTESIKLRKLKEEREEIVAVDGVFIAVGLRPNAEMFQGIVPCDESGYLIAGEDCVTGHAGIFAAGDVRTKILRQIVTAVADGANAVFSAEKYIL